MSSSESIPVKSLETTPNGSSDSRGEEQVERMKKRVIEPDQFGFHILRQPADPEDIEVDVIAIHGIAATPKYTWVDKESQVNWLKDSNMLPAVLPNARIMTYSYESVWFGDNAVKQSLDDVAIGLLNALNNERSECPHRPILFIGHCFGGLVSLKCYITATMFGGDYPGISASVAGMMFLGTPFHGIASDSGLATMGEVYLAIVKSKVQMQDNLMTTIAHDNDILVSTVSNFSKLLERPEILVKPKIFCCFESKASEIARKVAGISGFERKFLVTRSSGTLPQHGHEGLALNHFSINKFVSENDNNYKIVSREIKKMNDNAMELIEARRSGLPSREETKIGRLSPTPKYPMKSGRSRAGPIEKEKNFANRDGIINNIEERLQKTTCVALYGDSGNGKTHVAVGYAHKFFQDYDGHVHWVNAGSAAEFELSYKSIAKTLGINRGGMTNDDVLQEVYDTLRHDGSGRWLMVVDGWDSESALKATSASRPEKSLLDYIQFPTELARVLVTTRSKKIARRIVGQNPQYTIKVSQLKDSDASLLLLGEDTKDLRARRKAAARAKELGGSAGTLVLAQSYLEKAPGEPKPKMEMILGGQTKDTSNTMRVWRLLYELVSNKHDEAAELLLVMGSMNVQCIPNSFFERDQLFKQMELLVSYGMVEPSADNMVTIVTATIRECVQKYLDEEKEREVVEEQVLSVMCNKFHGDEHRTAEVLLPCALVALKFQPTSADIKHKLASLHSEVAKLYRHTKQYQLAVDHWEQVISLCEEGHKNNHELAQGAKEALKEVRTQLESAETNTKAMVKTGYSKSQVARKEQELLEWERSAGEHHPETMRKRGEIATLQLMHGGKGEAQNSIENNQRVLEWFQNKQGNNSIDVARQRNNLALAFERQGEYEKAENHYTSAIDIAGSHLGPDSPELLRILSNLASMYCKQGRLHDAERTLLATLQGQQKALGADHPDTLKTRQNMASLMGDKGQVDAAVEALAEVLRVQVELLGPNNPDTLRTACSLAIHLSMQGYHKKAESMLKETLRCQTKLLGEAHPDTTATKRNLKELLDQMEMVRV